MTLNGKNFSWKETLTLKPWERDKNILQTVPAIVKLIAMCKVILFKLQNKFDKYKLYLLFFVNNLLSVCVPHLMIMFHERFSK